MRKYYYLIGLLLMLAGCAPSVFWINGATIYPCASTIPGHRNYPDYFYAPLYGNREPRGLGLDYGAALPCVERAKRKETGEQIYLLWTLTTEHDIGRLSSREVKP